MPTKEELEAAIETATAEYNKFCDEVLYPAEERGTELYKKIRDAETTLQAHIRAEARKANKARLVLLHAGESPVARPTVMDMIKSGGGDIRTDYAYISSTGHVISRIGLTFDVTQEMLDKVKMSWSSKGPDGMTVSVDTFDQARQLYEMGAELKDGWKGIGKIGAYYESSRRARSADPESVYAIPKEK